MITSCWIIHFDQLVLSNSKGKSVIYTKQWYRWTTHWQLGQYRPVERIELNCTRINGSGLLKVIATGANSQSASGSGFHPKLHSYNGFYHTKTLTVVFGLGLPPNTWHINITTLATIYNLSSDHIVTWSVHWLCIINRPFTFQFQNCDPTYIRCVTIEISECRTKFGGMSQRLNEYSSHHNSECSPWKSRKNCTIHILIMSRFD